MLHYDDYASLLNCALGRIQTLIYLGSDGVERIAFIKTTGGITCRIITKMCPLPLENEGVYSLLKVTKV